MDAGTGACGQPFLALCPTVRLAQMQCCLSNSEKIQCHRSQSDVLSGALRLRPQQTALPRTVCMHACARREGDVFLKLIV